MLARGGVFLSAALAEQFHCTTVIRVTCRAATAFFMARMTGAVGRIGAVYFAIIALELGLCRMWTLAALAGTVSIRNTGISRKRCPSGPKCPS